MKDLERYAVLFVRQFFFSPEVSIQPVTEYVCSMGSVFHGSAQG